MHVYTYLHNIIPSCERSLHSCPGHLPVGAAFPLGTTWQRLQPASSGLIPFHSLSTRSHTLFLRIAAMPGRSSTAAADTAVIGTDEQLPTFDGSQIALAHWLRELVRYEHLLPAELAYWLVTGAANTAAGKTAVLSVHHAHLLHNNVVEQQGFNVVNPPPVEDKFLALYASTRGAMLAASGDDASDLPANPTMREPFSSQFMVSPVRLMQLDLQYRNILLGLI